MLRGGWYDESFSGTPGEKKSEEKSHCRWFGRFLARPEERNVGPSGVSEKMQSAIMFGCDGFRYCPPYVDWTTGDIHAIGLHTYIHRI